MLCKYLINIQHENKSGKCYCWVLVGCCVSCPSINTVAPVACLFFISAQAVGMYFMSCFVTKNMVNICNSSTTVILEMSQQGTAPVAPALNGIRGTLADILKVSVISSLSSPTPLLPFSPHFSPFHLL